MRQTRANPILRYGLIAALINAALLGVDQAIRALRPAPIQSPQGPSALTISFFASVALVTLIVGYLTARETGSREAAQWAGALAVGLPAALLAIVYFVLGVAAHNKPLETYALGAGFFAFAGLLGGIVVAAPGGLVGRWRYRKAHAEEFAARAAQRAAARAAVRQRRRSERLGVFGWLMVGAILIVTIAPIGLSYLALNHLSQWEGLAASLGALLVGYGLLKLTDRDRWQSYLYDLIGLTLIVSGLIVGIGEITGYAILLLAGPGTMAYIWRAMDRSLGIRKPSAADPPEPEPVLFRHDGESIDCYPSRRTLTGHALFAGGVSLTCGALAVIFHTADPTIVFGLGAFAVMGLIGFIPDLARLLHRWPTLTVTSDGIIDRGSGLLVGFGLIPWHEIEGVIGGVRLKRNAIAELLIAPVNFERLIARQPLLKRPLLRLGSAMRGGCIAISSLYLAQPTEEVAARIHDYVLSHAPASYLEPEESAEPDAADSSEAP